MEDTSDGIRERDKDFLLTWLQNTIQFQYLSTTPPVSFPQLCKNILPVLTTHSSHLPLPFLEVIAARLPIRLFQSIGIEEPGVGDFFIHGVGEPD